MQGQYAQIGQRPRHPGTLVDYKRNFRADLVGVSEREIREQWQQLLDEYEESREPSKDARFYTTARRLFSWTIMSTREL